MKKLLITGAAGFIGRHCIAPAIRHGYEVYVATFVNPCPIIEGVNRVHLDLFNYDQLQHLIAEIRPSHLLHLAWYAEPKKYWTSVENVKWIQASLELLITFQKYGGNRVVFAGSCAEYDWSYGYCSEAITPLNPATLYGSCKNSLQHVFTDFCAQTTLSSAWGRIFFIYGPHEHPSRLVPSVINSLLHGKDALCSHGEQVRDFMHVQDVADAFVALLDSEVQGPVNIGSGRPVSIGEIARRIAQTLNGKNLLKFGHFRQPAWDPPLVMADVTRLRDEVRWVPRHDLDAGLINAVEWWRTRSDAVSNV